MFRSKTLALIAAFLLAFPANAQLAQTGAGKNPSGGGGGFTGPLDIVGSGFACYSMRACSATAASNTTPAFRIQRTSDNIACDVRVTSTGDLNTNVDSASCTGGVPGSFVLTTFCNATTCVIITWYDQTGTAANNATVGVGAGPTLTLSCLGTHPCASFNGSQYIEAASSGGVSQTFSASAVAERTGAFTSQSDIVSAANGIYFNNATNQIGGFFGNQPNAAASDNAFHAMQFVVSGASSVINVDGTDNTGLNYGVNALNSSYFLGAQSTSPGNPLTGKIAEVILWNNGVSTNATQRTNVCHNQFTYWGTPTSC